jgi:oligopeptidase B
VRTPVAPSAEHRPHVREHHGDRVEDPFEWLRDKEDQAVIAHLEAENEYAEAVTAHLEPLRKAIFNEIKTRTQETDLSVPVRRGDWWYYGRTTEGKQYATHCRVAAGRGRPELEPGQDVEGEQVLLDGNVEAEGHEFFSLGGFEISPDGAQLAYAVDVAGDERFALKVKDLRSGEVIDEAVDNIGYGLAWSLDGQYLFYTRVDEAWRPHQVWCHRIGTSVDEDVKVFEETDERFWMGIGASRDDKQILIAVGSKTTSEALIIDAASPLDPPRVVAPRQDGVEYDVEPAGDCLLIVHNRNHKDFELAWAPLDSTSHEDWEPLLVPSEGERISRVEAFADHAVVGLRSNGLTAVRVLPRVASGSATHGFGEPWDVPVDEPVYTIRIGANPAWDAAEVQVVVESLVTPRSVYDVSVSTGEMTLLKRQPVLGGYDPADYVQRREWATAEDGTQIPISLVARRGIEPDGTAPGLLYGYGSYEHSIDPSFSVARLSMLDRGVVFAIGHIRGGGEMGRSWYEQGRLSHKKNTFSDFVACADHLVSSGWVAADRLGAEGRSAGGLLIGAAVNLAPSRFRVVHAGVPFVDALTTVLDPSLPLTVTEWEEWGDPLHDPAVYEYMRSYTPYENIQAVEYPAILSTTSLNDTRVYYVEPAKWIARLRETVKNDPSQRPIVLKTEMVAGHGGRSGRYNAWEEYAWELAFVLDQLGATELV